MKVLVLLFLFLINYSSGYTQNGTTTWVSGIYGGINFNGDTAVSFLRPDDNLIWRTSASICDIDGNLLFYTNGFRIFNSNFEIMDNGDSLNIGDYSLIGYEEAPTPDGALILPFPNNPSKYYVFHMDLNFIHLNEPAGLIFLPTHLLYNVVDMSLAGGLGAVDSTIKNIAILNDTLAQFGMKAVKHGNGRDWWLICHEYGSNAYYTFLIDTVGIHGPYIQHIGIRYEYVNAQIASIMKFTEDGWKIRVC